MFIKGLKKRRFNLEKRKRYLIDRKIQFFFLRFIILYLLLISVIFGYVLVRVNTYFTEYIVSTITTAPTLSKQPMDPRLVEDLKDVLLARDREFLLFIMLAIIVVGFVVAYLTIRFSHRVAGPVFRLRRAMGQLNEGDYSVRVKLRRSDQLSGFAEDFNHLAEKLQNERKGL